MAAEGAPRWRDRGVPRPPPPPRLPWRGHRRSAAEDHGTPGQPGHESWDPWSMARGHDPWDDGNDPWSTSWANITSDSTNPWEDYMRNDDRSWDSFTVQSADTQSFYGQPYFPPPMHEPLNVPRAAPQAQSHDPGHFGSFRATSSSSGVNISNRPRHDVPPPAAVASARFVFTDAGGQDMSQSSFDHLEAAAAAWMGPLRAEEPSIISPRAPPPSFPPPPPYLEMSQMSQVVFHRAPPGRDRESFTSGPSSSGPIPPGLVYPGGGVGLGVGVTVWGVASLSASRSLARGVIDAHTALYTFKQKDVRGEACDSASKKCCICLEDFAEEQQLRILPCFHRYHQDCIDEWLGRSDECPLCKFRITTDDTSFLDSVEVSSHGSATPGLATIDSGSEETDESVLGDLGDRAWSQAVGENNEDSFNVWPLPQFGGERQAAGSPSPASIERVWDLFDGLNTQVSNLSSFSGAHPPADSHEPPGADQVPLPFEEAELQEGLSERVADVPRATLPPINEEETAVLRPRSAEQDYILEVWERYQDAEGRHWFFCPRNNDWFYTDEAERSCWYQFCDPNTPETLWWWNSRSNRAFFEP